VAPPQVSAGIPSVLVVVEEVVEVVVGMQGASAHPSQQLVVVPTQALPPRRARHRLASRLMPQRTAPRPVVRQQVTAPGRPQVDLRRHRRAVRAQSSRSCPSATRLATTSMAQLLNAARLVAPAQSQVESAAMRVSVTAMPSID
jgi:hypothetical protein